MFELSNFFDPAGLNWIYDFIYRVVFQLTSAILAPITCTSDIYWIYLTSALLIGLVVAYRQRSLANRPSLGSFLTDFRANYFSKSIWGHPSALLDLRYYFVNAVIFSCLFAPIALQSSSITAALDHWASFLNHGTPMPFFDFKKMGDSNITALLLKAVYTIAFFVAYDAGRFIAHSLLHDIEWLWEFHKIHHSAQVLTPFTGFRVHPVDLLIMVSVPALTTGLLTWFFYSFVCADIDFYTLFNLHVLVGCFNFIDNLRHWNVWVTYPEPLNKWFISPAHHQLHHSAAKEHWGCNRGFELAVWDRLYKTLVIPSKEPEKIELGLGDGNDSHWRSLSQLYFNPFKALIHQLLNYSPKSAIK
jgi:sterol desaturase/sphingolipid hydroxylase (fatty acid hydroxylase superfamily)